MAIMPRSQYLVEEDVKEYRAVSLSEFADWAVSKRLSMPPELAGMASGPIPESRLSIVMDENHPDHSKELAGAIKAWLAVIIDNEGNKRALPKPRMLAHLKKQGFDGKTADRIATVCNPERRKKGGRA